MWWLLCMWYDWYGNFFERQGKNEFSSSALITERKQLREPHRCILTKPTLSTFVKLCQELAQQCAPPMKHWSHLCHPSRLWCHPGDGGEVSQKSVTPFGHLALLTLELKWSLTEQAATKLRQQCAVWCTTPSISQSKLIWKKSIWDGADPHKFLGFWYFNFIVPSLCESKCFVFWRWQDKAITEKLNRSLVVLLVSSRGVVYILSMFCFHHFATLAGMAFQPPFFQTSFGQTHTHNK